MPANEIKLLSVRLPEAEKRRIKIMAASQGVTIRQAIHEAFDAWALQLQSRAPTPDAARRAPAGADSDRPRPNHPATPRQDRRPAEAKPSSAPVGGQAPNADAPSINWLLRAHQLDWSKCAAAQSVPGERGNVWVVRGTRVPLAGIFKSVAEGYPFVEIQEVFGLTLQQLMAILQFAAEGAARLPLLADSQSSRDRPESSSAQVRWNETAGLAEQGKLSARTRYGAQETSLMKKSSRASVSAQKPLITVGIDLGDRFSRYCIVNADGEVMEEGRIATTAAALERHFGGEARQRIALECGTHSPWVSRLLQGMGHEVWVANARKLRAITASESKNDRNDAEKLARFAAYDPRLLSPIQHRSPERQRDLNLLQARDTLVRARTMLVNALRGLLKSAGHRLPKCSTESFARVAGKAI